MFDFEKFEKVDNTFERKGGYTLVKEQEYSNLKYRKAAKKIKAKEGVEASEVIEGRFYISNERFKGLKLDVQGLRQFTSPAPDGDTILAVVADADASILKSSKKSKDGNKVKNFKSPKLEAALEKLGIIDTTLVGQNQFIDLTSIATNVTIKGVPCLEVFTFSKGTAKPKTEKSEAPEVAETVGAPANAAVAPAKKADWD